jgi:UDP-GlcNAc:undecaprenyl-phosphate GlcNAc-1-phosphate transferase
LETLDFLSYFAIAFLISSVITPIVRRWAILLSVVDAPDKRKIHLVEKPRLGGTAIAASFLICLVIIAIVQGSDSRLLIPLQKGIPTNIIRDHAFGTRFFVAALVVFILGAWDDWHGATARVKFFWQIVASFIVIWHQEKFGIFSEMSYAGPWIQPLNLLTGVFWTTYVCNAFNLIDGLDGLAAGTAFFSCLGLFVVSITIHNYALALLILILAGAVLGFHQFNRYPARIFMGDSGSLFIGFCLAIFTLRLFCSTINEGIGAFIPILALGLPLADTTLAIVRRWLKASNVLTDRKPRHLFCIRAIFQADKLHIHHRLLKTAGTHKRASNYFYLINFFLFLVVSILAIFKVYLGTLGIAVIFGAILFAGYAVLTKLGYNSILFTDDEDVRDNEVAMKN